MEAYSAVLSFFQTGGLFMYPIAVVLTIGLVITLERWFFLSAAKFTNRSAYNKLRPYIENRQFDNLLAGARASSAPVSKIIVAALQVMPVSRQRDDVVAAMQEAAFETLPRLEKRTGYLSVLANVATLLGLLGTIIGLIAAFTAVADADPAQKATLLSKSISVAMNTTAFGLISAIPLLLFHALLQNKTQQIIESLDVVSIKFVNAFCTPAGAQQREGVASQAASKQSVKSAA